MPRGRTSMAATPTNSAPGTAATNARTAANAVRELAASVVGRRIERAGATRPGRGAAAAGPCPQGRRSAGVRARWYGSGGKDAIDPETAPEACGASRGRVATRRRCPTRERCREFGVRVAPFFLPCNQVEVSCIPVAGFLPDRHGRPTRTRRAARIPSPREGPRGRRRHEPTPATPAGFMGTLR